MSFSLSDVRAQLQKLGYDNVPDTVIDKFMARMKAKADADAAAAGTSSESAQAPLPGPPSTLNNVPYRPAALPLPVTYPAPLTSLPVTSPHYSALAQPLERHAAPTALPLPLSLRTNPAYTAQQAAYLPPAGFANADAQAQQASHYKAYQAALGQQQAQLQASAATAAAAAAAHSKRLAAVTVEDGSDGDDADEAYYRKKSHEIDALEARLKRHAAVAHGQTRVAPREQTAAPSSDENESDRLQQPRSSPARSRAFGSESRADNIAAQRTDAAAPVKSLLRDSIGSASARSFQSSGAQPRSILRPSSAQLRQQAPAVQQRPQTARPAPSPARPSSATMSARGRPARTEEPEEEEEEAVLHVEHIDTQRSLRKTYANSVQKFKSVNPRYGAGGYRKSDPVTRYHAFNSKWQSSSFLNKKKPSVTQQRPRTAQPEWQA